MANEIAKPDFSYQWSSGGAIVAPSNVKIQTGWTAEVPPFQWENWSQNRQDNAIVHLFQKGISEWDAASNYYFTTSGVRSYVQGSDGIIYVAVADSIGQNPTTDVSDTYWKVAFADNSTALTTTVADARYTQRSNNLSDVASVATSQTNLGVAEAVVSGIAGSASNLQVSTTGTSAVVTITADAICVKNATFSQKVLNSVAVTASFANAGANGLDVGVGGSQTALTWYYVWVIWNGTTTSGLISLSASAPTLPSGYTHKAYVGSVRTDNTGNKFPFGKIQVGRKSRYKVAAGTNTTALPVVANGVQGTVGTTGVAVTVSNVMVPPTAVSIQALLYANSSATVQLSPNSTIGLAGGTNATSVGGSPGGTNAYTDIVLEGPTVFYAGNQAAASCGTFCLGWEENT